MGIRQLLRRLEVPLEGGTLSNRWINNDIKPIEVGRRTWGFWAFHNLWVLTNMNISTYLVGSSLIALGLTYWQAIISIVMGAILTVVFIVLNSTVGSHYHIGFPVSNRFSWGMYGSCFVIYNRILLSLVWYAVQAWIGGECTYVCLKAIWPSIEQRIPNHMPESTGMTTAQFVAYLVFSTISLPLIWIRPHKLQTFFHVGVSTVVVFQIALLVWALATMGPAGFGSTITNREATAARADSIGWLVVYGIISTLGGISAGILNQSDYTRFARTPSQARRGQMISAGTYLVFSSVTGILVTAATEQRFGQPLWNLPDLLSAIIDSGGPRSRTAAFFAGAALIISQFGINIPGNALSGGFDLAATFPKYINIRRGAYITALVSMAVNPWQLLSTASTFLAVMSAYAVFLGPMVGVMITAYYIVHRRKINVDDLYIGDSQSLYWYTWGVNWRAVAAWTCGVAPSMPGFIANVNVKVVVPRACMRIYYINFITGFFISGTVFLALHTVLPARSQSSFLNNGVTWKENVDYYCDKWDNKAEDDRSEQSSVRVSDSGRERKQIRAVHEMPMVV